MAFILDASITVSWGLEDEDNPVADIALRRLDTEPAHVPTLWWFEVANVLLMNERRNRITERDTATFLHALAGMNIQTDRDMTESATLALARSHRLTAYDASYLELALRKSLPLATLDKKLAQAAESEGVPLII
jgi:predicted nucleic acid-binding protein